VRAVLDPNVLIAALISRTGAPAEVVTRGFAGAFEIVVSDTLLTELREALAAPKLRKRVLPEEAVAFASLLAAHAVAFPDPSAPPPRSADRDDDYLVALAERARGVLVSGDRHLLDLASELPVRTPGDFLLMLGQ
jgi:putative PIN family toxin of toxin-antitoxin system